MQDWLLDRGEDVLAKAVEIICNIPDRPIFEYPYSNIEYAGLYPSENAPDRYYWFMNNDFNSNCIPEEVYLYTIKYQNNGKFCLGRPLRESLVDIIEAYAKAIADNKI